MKRITIASLVLFLAVARVSHAEEKKDPRFEPAGERRIVELTEWLEANPLGDVDKSRRTEITTWWVDVPDLTLNWCASLLLEGKNEVTSGIVVTQGMFGAGKYLLQHRDRKDDELAISLAGVESAMRAYRNATKQEPKLGDAAYEKLAAKVGTDALTNYVKEKLKDCAKNDKRAK